MEVHGHQYEINAQGVLSQVNPKPIQYDFNYIANGYGNIADKRKLMSHLRLGYLVGQIGVPYNLLEIGYGTGDFLETASHFGIECFGNDVTGLPTPANASYVEDFTGHYDVVCMFDVLEHFEDINLIKDLNTKFVYVSVPNCSMPEDIAYLTYAYPHLKPNEHLHHFNHKSLTAHFEANGYKLRAISNIEDTIRKRPNVHVNIISSIFEKI